jgi:hypothetical protein
MCAGMHGSVSAAIQHLVMTVGTGSVVGTLQGDWVGCTLWVPRSAMRS